MKQTPLRIHTSFELFGAVSAIVLAIFCHQAMAVTYYVSTGGSDANSGTSLSSPWKTIQKAANVAAPGDRVHIRSGNYAEAVTFPRNGTSSLPIVFEGYQSAPGDNPNLDFEIGDSLNPNIMPLLTGTNPLNPPSITDIALDLRNRRYVTVKNLQLKNYTRGVFLSGTSNIALENIIGIGFGRGDAGTYNGDGFYDYNTTNSSFKRIIIGNAVGQNMLFAGNGNLIEDCMSFCNNTQHAPSGATDYYFLVSGSNNTFNRCHVERVGDLAHPGHGLHVKYGDNNVFNLCKVVNLGEGIHVQGTTAIQNKFNDCDLTDTRIILNDAAHYNEFRRCHLLRGGIAWRYTVQSNHPAYPVSEGPGYQNYFYDCTFEDVVDEAMTALHYEDFTTQSTLAARHDRFYNCHFKNYYCLFRTQRSNYATLFTNCTFTNVMHYLREGNYPLSSPIFQGSSFVSCGFPPLAAPQGAAPNTETPVGGGYPLTNISTGLVGHWKFDVASGGVALDSGSGGNPGTLVGNASFVSTGKIGRCIYLDGVGDYISVGDKNDLLGGSLTVAAWVKADSWVNYAGIVSKLASGGNYRLLVGGSRVFGNIRSATNIVEQIAFYEDDLKVNRWYHVAMVFDEATKTADIYVDGILRQFAPYTITRGDTSSPLEIGRNIYNGNVCFKGFIDDVRIYNRALDIYQLKTLAESF